MEKKFQDSNDVNMQERFKSQRPCDESDEYGNYTFTNADDCGGQFSGDLIGRCEWSEKVKGDNKFACRVKPCMQSQKDFVNCGTCVNNRSAGVSLIQRNINQTTGELYLEYYSCNSGNYVKFNKDLNMGDNESIKITPRSLPYITETEISLKYGTAGDWGSNSSQPEDWTHDYEVYTIQNPGDNSEILKICVRKVGDIRTEGGKNNSYTSEEPEMPIEIARYLRNNLSIKSSTNLRNIGAYLLNPTEYSWSAADGEGYWEKTKMNNNDVKNKFTKSDYKAHLDKFNNYNLEIRIHPDYEDKYKFGMGTKDSKPTSTNVFTHWYFNRLLQLPIHETQFKNKSPSDGLPAMDSFFQLQYFSRCGMRTYPNEDMDYLYFYNVVPDLQTDHQSRDASPLKFKVNWAEIVTKIHEDPKCYLHDNDRNKCAIQTKTGFKGGNESMCIYQPKVHCKGEWRDPPTVVDVDGNNVANTCGLVQSGVKIKQYVELSASKLDAINDVWNPGNYQSIIGAQCEEEDIGWLVYQDLDASTSGQVATDTFRMKTREDGSDNPKYDPSRELPKGITGTPQTGTWKRAVPKHGDLKYEACSSDCVEADVNTACEKNVSGDYDERNRMRIPPEYELGNSYDFSNAWDASENNCSGNFTTYKTITKFAQGADPETKCPNFTLEQSRGNMDEIHKRNYIEEFVRGGACTLPKQTCIAGSSCIVNTVKLTNLVGRINSGENLVKINNGTASEDDDSLEIEIDGTRYNKENNITEEILFRLAKKECDRFGDLSGSPNKAFCTEDKTIYVSETPGVPPCEKKAGVCFLEENTGSTTLPGTTVSKIYTSSAGIKVFFLRKKEVIDGYKWEEKTKFIKPFEFCKWIEMPDLPSE